MDRCGVGTWICSGDQNPGVPLRVRFALEDSAGHAVRTGHADMRGGEDRTASI